MSNLNPNLLYAVERQFPVSKPQCPYCTRQLVKGLLEKTASCVCGYTEIECDCNDDYCERIGPEGEVSNHIEGCSCGLCHAEIGMI